MRLFLDSISCHFFLEFLPNRKSWSSTYGSSSSSSSSSSLILKQSSENEKKRVKARCRSHTITQCGAPFNSHSHSEELPLRPSGIQEDDASHAQEARRNSCPDIPTRSSLVKLKDFISHHFWKREREREREWRRQRDNKEGGGGAIQLYLANFCKWWWTQK